jgi:hypothetical protein
LIEKQRKIKGLPQITDKFSGKKETGIGILSASFCLSHFIALAVIGTELRMFTVNKAFSTGQGSHIAHQVRAVIFFIYLEYL